MHHLYHLSTELQYFKSYHPTFKACYVTSKLRYVLPTHIHSEAMTNNPFKIYSRNMYVADLSTASGSLVRNDSHFTHALNPLLRELQGPDGM